MRLQYRIDAMSYKLAPGRGCHGRRATGSPAVACLFIAFLGLALVSAAPPSPPDDLVRRANEAVAAGDLDQAETLFGLAEERTTDPGLVAFNRGTLAFRRGDYRRAELCFRRTLGDAAVPAERRGRALYNLGNCLVRQAGDNNVRLLQAAIECYERTLAGPEVEGLQADARHNLEVAKLLWARARARKPQGDRDPEWEDPTNPKQPPPDLSKPPETLGNEDANEGPKASELSPKPDGKDGSAGKIAPKEADKTAPGAGNLPVIEDNDEVKSLSPEDARAVLLKAAGRIRRERQHLREEAAQGDRPNAKDW